MKIVKVIYTAKLDYVEQNKTNIKAVMNDLQRSATAGIFYTVCLSSDGKSFIHTAYFKSEEDHKSLNDLASFKYFQEQLKSNGLEKPPNQELLTLVNSSKAIFND
jgi:hypothetical protein